LQSALLFGAVFKPPDLITDIDAEGNTSLTLSVLFFSGTAAH
jgi:hypothetical protein